MPFELGGLGLKEFEKLTSHCYAGGFGKRILKEKYGGAVGGFFPKNSLKPIGTSLWRGLAKVEDLFVC